VFERSNPRPGGGVGGTLLSLGATMVALVRTRLELATIEFEEERERTKEMLVLIVVATVFFSFALVFLSVLVLLWLWDSHPLSAIIGLTLVYAAICGGAVLMLRRRGQFRPFAATLAELEKDAAALRRKS